MDHAISEYNHTDLNHPDVAARVRAIRSRLRGQMLKERLESARCHYGPLYTLEEVRRKTAETLPRRIGYMRGAVVEPIDAYTDPIPDDALLKYDDAVQGGVFSTFFVVTPSYYGERQTDPWIVGEVTGVGLFAVIARWDQ